MHKGEVVHTMPVWLFYNTVASYLLDKKETDLRQEYSDYREIDISCPEV